MAGTYPCARGSAVVWMPLTARRRPTSWRGERSLGVGVGDRYLGREADHVLMRLSAGRRRSDGGGVSGAGRGVDGEDDRETQRHEEASGDRQVAED